MAVESKSAPQEEEDEQPPSHNPSAPSDEFSLLQLFDISTTVDPSYVISLIRTLLPPDVRNSHNSNGVGACEVTAEKSEVDEMEECTEYPSENEDLNAKGNGVDAMDTVDDLNKHDHQIERDEGSYGTKFSGVSVGQAAWEDYGCILWDLAASKTHAEFMVQNLLLEVLVANLMVSQSSRATEICLGIVGNLACHEVPRKLILATNGLVKTIVDQLFLDDTQCLCEVFRLFALGFQSSDCVTWAEALHSEHILSRILWITENALNPQLIEKSVGLLLAILESQQVWPILLPPLMKLGLPTLLNNLLAFEMDNLTRERAPERYSVLEMVLRSIEALSVIDGYSQEICSSKELLQLVYNLAKLPDKFEVANSCVAAAVLIANILSDATDAASEISQDLPFLQGLLEIFPFASDDSEAQNAIWSILARLLVRVQENVITPSSLHQYVLVLVSKMDLIEENLLDDQSDNCDNLNLTDCGLKQNARTIALRKIISILNQWNATKDGVREEKLGGNHAKDGDGENGWMGENYSNDESVNRLLLCCRKYVE